jgi:hypothetical protein
MPDRSRVASARSRKELPGVNSPLKMERKKGGEAMASHTEQMQFIDFDEAIPPAQWALYDRALQELRRQGLPCAVGGGLAFSAYARRWRNTKDMDLFIRPADCEAAIAALQRAGFADYYPQAPYDRRCSFRGIRDGIIVDLLWEMLNGRARVDAAWLSRGPTLTIRGSAVRFLAPEELIWSKLYVLQRERCDWPDLLNILAGAGPALDWTHLLDRIGPDAPLLGGVLSVLRWLSPASARELPAWIWRRVGLAPWDGNSAEPVDPRMLGNGDWFGPTA